MSDICSKCGFDMDAQFEARSRLIDKLEAYEKGCANLESELAHLRQENADLKAKNFEMREVLLDCSLHFEEMEDVIWNDDSDINSTTFQRVQESVQKSLTQPNLQPTQDPATAIAYGLYPSSARPVNPKP